MNLSAGDRLGRYEILAPLGRGGMGEVYRARDTRLGRTVALKIVPPDLAREERSRLEREAKTVSALTHPNICTLHDLDRDDAVEFLVMEYCEGKTLEDALLDGPIPIDEALRIGCDLATALARVHREGFVHRDLKPSNVILTKEGTKLLDFGIATRDRLRAAPSGTTATENRDAFAGTTRYMAPEVLSGSKADARSDVFALGLVIYEMLAGRPAFDGTTSARVAAAILEREPEPLRALTPSVPSSLEHLVGGCLAKDPDARWQSAHDIAVQLRWMAEARARDSGISKTQPRTSAFLRLTALALLLALAGAISWIAFARRTPNAERVVRLSIPLAEGERLSPLGGLSAVAISPDGKRIAYVGSGDGTSRIFVRELDGFESVMVPNSETGVGPFFSPDSQWVSFVNHGSLVKASVKGGPPENLYAPITGNAGRGAVWAADGSIYFSPSANSGLLKVSENGGPAVRVTEMDVAGGETSHRWPRVLPGGKYLLFTIRTAEITTFDDARIALLSLEDGSRRVILDGGADARYAAGHILYGRDGALFAVPFDLRTMQVTGPKRRIVDGVVTIPTSGATFYDVDGAGNLVYVPGGTLGRRTSLVLADSSGRTQPLVSFDRPIGTVRLSPDRTKAAMVTSQANDDIWVCDLPSGVPRPLTFERGDETLPQWTADSTEVIYRSFEAGGLVARKANGAGGPRLIHRSPSASPGPSLPDGKSMLFVDHVRATRSDIWIKPLDGSGPIRPLVKTPFHELAPRLSRDGRWLTYVSDDSGKPQIYVQRATPEGERKQVSSGGGEAPRWSDDGKRIYYRQGDRFYRVAFSAAGSEIQLGEPELMFERPGIVDFDVGDGFVMIEDANLTQPFREVRVVLGFARAIDSSIGER